MFLHYCAAYCVYFKCLNYDTFVLCNSNTFNLNWNPSTIIISNKGENLINRVITQAHWGSRGWGIGDYLCSSATHNYPSLVSHLSNLRHFGYYWDDYWVPRCIHSDLISIIIWRLIEFKNQDVPDGASNWLYVIIINQQCLICCLQP